MGIGQNAPNLRARRVSANLTPDQLAQKSGLSLKAILRAEHAAATGAVGAVLNASDMARLAAALGTTVTDLRGA
jgi:transcriptional regulator with XRE-family HTH domain